MEVGSARLGTTTQGWRPISVKIHPKEAAMKGSGMVHSATRAHSLVVMRRSLRLSHRITAPTPTDTVPRPIIMRKDQKVTMTSGV